MSPNVSRRTGDVPWDQWDTPMDPFQEDGGRSPVGLPCRRCLSPRLESVVLIPKASTLVLDSMVPTLNPLEDSMEPLKVEPSVLVLAPKAPTHLLTPKDGNTRSIGGSHGATSNGTITFVLDQTAPTLVLTPKASTLDPLEDFTEPLVVEPSVCVLAQTAPTLVLTRRPQHTVH